MSQTPHQNNHEVPLSLQRRVDQLCLRFERAWKAGQRPSIEDYLGTTPEPERSVLFRELLTLELAYRRRGGEIVVVEEYQHRFAADGLAPQRSEQADSARSSVITEPGPIRASDAVHPVFLGRYRLTVKLGAGSFGVVYRG